MQKEATVQKPVRPADTLVGREPKRKRQDEQFEDISMETVAQIISTIDDPNYMTGPDVCNNFKKIGFFSNFNFFVL